MIMRKSYLYEDTHYQPGSVAFVYIAPGLYPVVIICSFIEDWYNHFLSLSEENNLESLQDRTFTKSLDLKHYVKK